MRRKAICNMDCFHCLHPDCINDEVKGTDRIVRSNDTAKNTDRQKRIMHEYYVIHKDVLKERSKRYYREHPEQFKQYREKYRERYRTDPDYRKRIIESRKRYKENEKAKKEADKK